MKMNRITAALVVAMLSSGLAALEGKEVYDKACHICHSMGVAGAPKTGDSEAWQPLLEKGIDALVASVKTGKGAMPPGGLCTDCTDDDYKKAIEFMSQ